ncbi:MAG: hypothetical protein IJ315_01675 [Firmicutes bacterium]|nr:hypothetical protein [Bacillota bacterium]
MDKWFVQDYDLSNNSVTFKTDDAALQQVFDSCEDLCKKNIREFGDYTCLIEGAKYIGVWLETQPLGGEMYAKRDLSLALANILIFMRYQRRDGRLPGMIRNDNPWHGLSTHYDWMQGCFLPHAALKMYYLLRHDKDYLDMLYKTLKDFDDYLWRYRDSNGNGCLETWCIWDGGDDNSTVFSLNGIIMPEHGAWGKSVPPTDYQNLPFDSPQYMSYSYACRDVLAKISAILNNDEQKMWEDKAKAVLDKAYEMLWDKERHAYFNYDKNGNKVDALSQENVKCMYAGMMTPEMAKQFLEEHLLNEEEFFTHCPFPSIAANDSFFHLNPEQSNCYEKLLELGALSHDIDDNSWGGPVNGLIWQRSIDAFLNYGFHKETALFGKRFLATLKQEQRFVQCYNPFSGKAAPGENGYGPTLLAALEYISILCGVNIRYDKVLWSCAADMGSFEYTQRMFDTDYTLTSDGTNMHAYINGVSLFSMPVGTRIETDLEGNILNTYSL